MRLIFGAGYVGARVAQLAAVHGDEALCVVRSASRLAELEQLGLRALCTNVVEAAKRYAAPDVHAIVCFPPDGHTDAALAQYLAAAGAVTYVSSTGVYGSNQGVVNDDTLPASGPSARLEAEAAYRALGGTVLRAPGIYGPDRGLHVRVHSGLHKLPGAAENYVSRIHVDDLAALLLASDKVQSACFVVGDAEPSRQCDVVEWICEEYGCAVPPTVPEEQVHASLRGNRMVDGRRALRELDVVLRYPSYRDGMRRVDASSR